MKNKENKGITLIALIITILVLLILATISVQTLTGDNSLLAKATTAKNETKKMNYKEIIEIIGLGLQSDRIMQNWNTQKYMDLYQEAISKDDAFANAQEIKQLTDKEEITIQIITEEGWIYWVTANKVEYKENLPPSLPEPEYEETDLYASLNGNTLCFFDNETEATEFADSTEHIYGNIRGRVFTRGYQRPPDTPWIGEAEKIQTINFATAVVPTNMACYFSDLTSLTKIENIKNLKTEKVTSMYALFYNCTSLEEISLSNFNTKNVETMDAMFYNCTSLKSIILSTLDTSKVTNMNSMFAKCSNLTNLDLSSFDMSLVKDMGYMFQLSSKLQTITFPQNLNTSQATFMREMFSNGTSLTTLDLSQFDTSNVTNMLRMFSDCTSLTTLNLSGFDTSQITDMTAMFQNCHSLTSLDLSSFTTPNVTAMDSVFKNCQQLKTLSLPNFNTEKVTIMASMFEGCSNLVSLDLSSFYTKNTTNFAGMFWNCSNLKELNCSGFEIKSTAYIGDMFNGCNTLQKLDIRKFNLENHTGTKTYAFYNIPNNTEILTNEKMKIWFSTNYPSFTNIKLVS